MWSTALHVITFFKTCLKQMPLKVETHFERLNFKQNVSQILILALKMLMFTLNNKKESARSFKAFVGVGPG